MRWCRRSQSMKIYWRKRTTCAPCDVGALPRQPASSIASAAQIRERWQAAAEAAGASAPAPRERCRLLTEVVADKLRDVVLRWSDGDFFSHELIPMSFVSCRVLAEIS